MVARPRARERVTRLHDLELKHRENIRKTDNINRDEEARLLQVKLLATRDDTAALKDQIAEKDDMIVSLKKTCEDLRSELDDNKKATRAQDARMKKQNMEFANLKAEVDSLGASVQDSSKALQEKFALTRELERLRPEMDHLKSQLANYQATIAEKNDLRRQLDTIEVELENEKRARQRTQQKEDDAAMAALKTRLEKAEKKAVADAKEQEKTRKDHERALAESQALNERLEERIETLKTKYKTSQSELKETRSRLESCQAQLETAKKTARSAKEPAKKSVTIDSGLNRKRKAQEMSFEDITIQTPGNEDVVSKRLAAKKRTAEQAAVGEKSTFSITPFLKRTKNLADDSAEGDGTSDEAGPDSTFAEKEDGSAPLEPIMESQSEEESAPEPVAKAAPKRKVPITAATKALSASKAAAKPRGKPKTKGLAVAPPAEANKMISKGEVASSAKAPVLLGTVAELPGAEEQENSSDNTTRKATAPASKVADGDAKKKKRKLLRGATQTLLGDEDGETTIKPPKPVVVPKKARAPLAGGVRNAFAGASFSPLKRDRRGVNASFLS
ncbi:hypothetical protein HIM_08157 [Hirsutella minnesotensis 3608]|uniref:Uncharacterized protein n=1 Tax=Hirsutella minnesotensis 3608 TaxID=1043627 RepID=A0A0F7ZT48_9HYPO|nr:hypothetical protein HIM_08157 [Hirsutella minnesotensis 3608]